MDVCMSVEAAKKAVEVAKETKVGGIPSVKKCNPAPILSGEERKKYEQWDALCEEMKKRAGSAMSPNRAGYYAACYEMLDRGIITEYDMMRMIRLMDEAYDREGLRWSIRDHIEKAIYWFEVRISQYKEAVEILEKYTKLLGQKSAATLYWEREEEHKKEREERKKRKGEV